VNGKTKKILLAALLVVVLTAGIASAREWKGRHWKNREQQGREWRGHGNRQCGLSTHDGKRCDGCSMGEMRTGRTRMHRMNTPEVPQEIMEKWAEAQKMRIDLRAELGKKPIDREKALELHAKHQNLMQEISAWRFKQRLDTLVTP